jgi:hypothetical protein
LTGLGVPQAHTTHRVVAEPVEVQTRVAREPKAEPVEVFAETGRTAAAETGIVRVVDGIPFTLPALTCDGAEQARIRLTDLAQSLEYKDKDKDKDGLKKLAVRNQAELAEFGTIDTVSVVSGFGRVTEEPTFNPDQAAYLALSSETATGRACRVRILKAYKSLVAMFEQIVAAPIVDPTSVILSFMERQAAAVTQC